MAEKNYPKSVRCFKKHEKAPEYVLGEILISEDVIEQNAEHLTEYQGKKQLRLTAMNGRNGLYVVINDYKKKSDDPFA